MNWVQEHLQILIAAAAAIAYFLNSRRSARDENDETKRPVEQASAEHAERTRRVQEEIRRKIAERPASSAVSNGKRIAVMEYEIEAEITHEFIRNGSRGLNWLEPLVEVATASGRYAYGPVGIGDIHSTKY